MLSRLHSTGNARVGIATGLAGFSAIFLLLFLLTRHSGFSSQGSIGRLNLARGFLQDKSMTDNSKIGVAKDGLVHNLHYISNAAAADRLSCPVNHSLACFYSFQADLPDVLEPSNGALVTSDDCVSIFHPLPSDRGREWCIRKGREPPWLKKLVDSEQRFELPGPVLLTGALDGPNPTHQANLHFHAIWAWMKKQQLLPGKLHMIVDSPDTAWSPGRFGTGLAKALGDVRWLPLLMPGVYHFHKIQFSIPDGELFPFDLKRHEIDAPIDSDYLEMAESVKMRTGCLAQNDITTNLKKGEEGANNSSPCTPRSEPMKPTIVLSRRKEPESRIWKNVNELALELRASHEADVKVITFGELEFHQQVQTVAAADVLVGITGSDLVNLMFLPLTGSVVEIFPSMERENVFVPELANMAKMLGKNHFTYVANGNITLNEGESRLLFRTKAINVAVQDLAALVRHALHQTRYGSKLESCSCTYSRTSVQCKPTRTE